MEAKKILVVEDSPYLSDLIVDMLTMKGHQTVSANSGREGIHLALAHHPDLIMLDIRLPDIDGYEVYRKIREDSWGAKANFLVLTASESIETISKNINLPRNRVLFKPDASVPDLLQIVEDAMNDSPV